MSHNNKVMFVYFSNLIQISEYHNIFQQLVLNPTKFNQALIEELGLKLFCAFQLLIVSLIKFGMNYKK